MYSLYINTVSDLGTDVERAKILFISLEKLDWTMNSPPPPFRVSNFANI